MILPESPARQAQAKALPLVRGGQAPAWLLRIARAEVRNRGDLVAGAVFLVDRKRAPVKIEENPGPGVLVRVCGIGIGADLESDRKTPVNRVGFELSGEAGEVLRAQVALSAPVPFPEIWWAPYETCVRK